MIVILTTFGAGPNVSKVAKIAFRRGCEWLNYYYIPRMSGGDSASLADDLMSEGDSFRVAPSLKITGYSPHERG